MNIVKNLFKGTTTNNLDKEIQQKGFEISQCSEICESCTSKFPKHLKFEGESESTSLWNTTKPYGMHIIIATGKKDWSHDAINEDGKKKDTLKYKIGKWAENNTNSPLGTIKVNVSSMSSDELYINENYKLEKQGDLLILPYFLNIKGITIDEVDTYLNELESLLIKNNNNNDSTTNNNDSTIIIDEIITKLPKISPNLNQSFVFFCSHTTRDKRCGITAPIMKREIDNYLQELDLIRNFGDYRPNGIQTEFINHIGGHKYAANVIIYLKKSGKNIWLGLCKPNNIKPIVDECILGDGKVWPNKVRLLQKFDPIEW
ncbi:hypothetical protein MG5_02564 [Candida albicans P57072]|nr:hypothetical protein MG1_02590 [Candida albicans GC75]KGR10619.1 hypothetical protein MG5_02564 [Candida albicans P57072]KGU09983.1 hypothetical protein MEQ_02545 [Candida albicans P87]KGU30953.1 hypothetical protein MGM_02568 [Candida albicans P75063]KHC36459.1 hypothetical protein MGO_02545 [Candida albicans P76055]KHC38823.1 hypothetical protein MGQ_02556 [Candida albicans P76067]KHC44100.1 hypothetical protein W5O_02578 [Candida albicans Ca6]KHC64518.1 hypothetical protein MGE_02570 [